MTTSERLAERAKQVMPGGVNSPVRACTAVGGHPVYLCKGNGAEVIDVDGRSYVDFVGAWGPMLLGHNHPEIQKAVTKAAKNGLTFGACHKTEVELAELICRLVPSVELVRMVNSGTEAVMSAIRLARGVTGRNKIIKFAGCYHGHCDAMLVKAGSGMMTGGIPDSDGVPAGAAADTLIAEYNHLDQVRDLLTKYDGEVAAVIVEPVAANMGVVLPQEGFLSGLRQLCTESGALLIFDEVITGFRLGISGAQGVYAVTPDLTTFGKIIGGGMPVGAYGGRRALMEQVAPMGPVYQAGTLSGNPIAMAAGLAQLRILEQRQDLYNQMQQMGEYFRKSMGEVLHHSRVSCQVTGIGSLSCLFFTEEAVVDAGTARASNTEQFARYYQAMLERGFYLAPSQFEAIFLSAAHTKRQIDHFLEAADDLFCRWK